jgi:tetratricopeptide (TPR) repeat protein
MVFVAFLLILLSSTAFADENQTIDKTIEVQTKIIELNSNDADAYYNRGCSYALKLQYDLAIADFNKAIELNPGNSNFYLDKADSYVKMKKYKEAIDTYYKLVATIPTDRKNIDKAREKVKALNYLPQNPGAAEFKEKAMMFNQILNTPIWLEKTVIVKEENLEKAKKNAINSVQRDAREIYKKKVTQMDDLRIPWYSIEISPNIKILQEDVSGDYGSLVKNVSQNANVETWKVTFRFLVQCENPNDINPYIKKAPYNKPSIIKDFKEYDDHWEITAVGYGFYESFEDIDFKIGVSFRQGVDNACNEIIKKAIELGITDKDLLDKIAEKIRAKRNYGGIYKVLGCGVEADAYVPVRLNKNDASITFIYN